MIECRMQNIGMQNAGHPEVLRSVFVRLSFFVPRSTFIVLCLSLLPGMATAGSQKSELGIRNPNSSFILHPSSFSEAAQIEPDLLRRLEAADNPNQKFAVSFTMKEQVSPLDLDPDIPNLPRPERRARVTEVLRDYAQSSQHDLLAYLECEAAAGKVTGLNSLWIVNEVACFATRDVILTVLNRDDLSDIMSDLVPADVDFHHSPFTIPDSPPRFGHERNLDVIQAPAAWRMGYAGQNVVVADVGTGIRYTHLDLRNHLWTSPAYPHCGFNYGSYELFPSATNPSPNDTLDNMDQSIVGTHEAGIVSADGSYGNRTHDTMGVAPAARMMACCVLVYFNNDNSGETLLEQSILLATQFCVSPPRDPTNGADVIVTALGIPDSYHPRYANYRAAERNVMLAGVINCVAGGNEAVRATIRCPGDVPPPWPNPANHPTDTATAGVITTGATDNYDNRASFTSLGPTVIWPTTIYGDFGGPHYLTDPDACAPAVNILAPSGSGDSAYQISSGTSQAAPAVAGCIALMLSKNPDLTPRETDSILECFGVHDLGAVGKDDTFGAGRINCSLAVAYTPTPVISVGEKRVTSNAGRMTLVASPNPFRDRVTLSLQLTANSLQPGIRIYNAGGRLVRSLVIPHSALRIPHCLTWDGTDDLGRKLPAGVYLARLEADDGLAATRELLLLR